MEKKKDLYHNINRPLYLQLKDILIEQIKAGELQPGDMIPGERKLAEIYDISRVTVRKCIAYMVEEGYLIRKQGKDTVIADRKINHRLGLLLGIAEELSETEQNVQIRELRQGYTIPPTKVADALNLDENFQVFFFDRIVYSEGKPVILNYSYVSPRIGKMLEGMNFNTARVFIHLEHCGYNLSYAEQNITAGLCRKEESQYLEYEQGQPVLIITRTTYVETGVPILYEKSVYRGDAYQYSVKLYRKLQKGEN